MLALLAVSACLAVRLALPIVGAQAGSVPPATGAEGARVEEWNAFYAKERTSPPALEGKRWTGPAQPGPDLRLLLGMRLAEEDVEPLEELYTGALELGMYAGHPNVSVDLGFAYSRDEDELGAGEQTGEVMELYAGPRWAEAWGASTLYMGLGGSLSWTEVELESGGGSLSDDETLFGVYARAGVEWKLGRRLRLGVDVRHVFSEEADSNGSEDLDMDSTVASVVLGCAL